MENRSLVTIAEHSKEKILYMLEMAKQFEMNPNRRLLQGKVVATLFFEPSTRTRLSFETAANRLGARVIGFTDPKATSSSKGETLKDTIMMVSSYADIIVMRHYLEGAARYASEVAPVPIVNAGDGANQHPSQTMLDLYSIYKTQGTLENLNIFLVGDLKYGRTVHSLLMAMRHFNPTFHFIAPDELKMPEEYKLYCKEHQIKYIEHTEFTEEIIADADILYMTRCNRDSITVSPPGCIFFEGFSIAATSTASIMSCTPSSDKKHINLPTSFRYDPGIIPGRIEPLGEQLQLLPSHHRPSHLRPPFLR